MLKCNGKISTRQAMILFILSTLSPTIRIFPAACSQAAKTAAWVTPIVASVALIVLYSVISAYFNKKNITNLNDVFKLALGTTIGKVVLSAFLFWFIVLYVLYIRYYAGRLLGSIFPNTDLRFFILVMIIIVYIAAKGRIETFLRFAEVVFLSLFTVMFFMFIFLLPEVKLANIYPVTFYDSLPLLKVSVRVMGVWGYMLLPFFFGESIANKEEIKRFGKQSTIFIVAFSVVLLITVVGSLGPSVASRMPFPFFNAVKLITFMESFDRFESLILALWVAADFVIITLFAFVIMHIIKNLFSLSEVKYLATPIASIGYIGSQYICNNRFELEAFTTQFAVYANMLLLYIVPIIILFVGKIRKKI